MLSISPKVHASGFFGVITTDRIRSRSIGVFVRFHNVSIDVLTLDRERSPISPTSRSCFNHRLISLSERSLDVGSRPKNRANRLTAYRSWYAYSSLISAANS